MKYVSLLLIAASSAVQAQQAPPPDPPSTTACKQMLGAAIGRELDANSMVAALRDELAKKIAADHPQPDAKKP